MLLPPRVRAAVQSGVVALALVLGLLVAFPATAQAAQKAPSGLSAPSRSSNAVRLTWKPVSKAAAYLVKYSSNKRLKHPSYFKTASPTAEIGKLKASRTYYFKVKALKASGSALTKYGKTKKVKTRSKKSYSVLSPAGLTATANYGDELTLAWGPQGTTNRYLVRWATKKSMKSARSLTVTGTTTLIEGLVRATPYYFTVEVRSARNKSVSQRSGVVKITTAKLISFGTPSGVEVSRVNPTDLTLSWSAVRKAPQYRIAYAAGSWAETDYLTTASTTIKLAGLIANTDYVVKIQATDAVGQPAGEFSTAIAVKTPAQDAVLRVASYNIHCHTCSPRTADPSADEQPWTVRRAYVAATIKDSDLDVVALQEAQQSWLDDSPKGGISQFEDLVRLLGSRWELTNPNRNNCVKSTTPTDCVYANKGASNGTKIIYNKDRVRLEEQGSTLLPATAPDNPDWTDPDPYPRWLAWAVLQQRSTGKRFLFGAIHLEPRNDASDENPYPGTSFFGNIRRAQAQGALTRLNEMNSANLPIVLAGDIASSRAEPGGNLPYPVFTGGGLVDPLGGTSTRAATNAPAQTRINIAFNSVNKYERLARRYAPAGEPYIASKNSSYNGAYNDYIFVSSAVRVSEFEQVVNVDAAGNFVDVIPSDHNLIRATLWLP